MALESCIKIGADENPDTLAKTVFDLGQETGQFTILAKGGTPTTMSPGVDWTGGWPELNFDDFSTVLTTILDEKFTGTAETQLNRVRDGLKALTALVKISSDTSGRALIVRAAKLQKPPKAKGDSDVYSRIEAWFAEHDDICKVDPAMKFPDWQVVDALQHIIEGTQMQTIADMRVTPWTAQELRAQVTQWAYRKKIDSKARAEKIRCTATTSIKR